MTGRRRPRILIALLGAGLLAGGGYAVLDATGGSSPPSADALRTVDRGPIVATVGGVGHVTAGGGAGAVFASTSSPAPTPGGGAPSAATPVAAAPPAGGSSASGGSASAPVSGSSAGSGAAGASSGRAAGAGAGAGASSPAPADAIFPRAAGRVAQVLVSPGQQIPAGAIVARLEDDGSIRSAQAQTQLDLRTAQLELEQRRISDPAKGLPPTPAELAAGQAAVAAAQEKLRRLTRAPDPVEVGGARLDLHKAQAELDRVLATARTTTSSAELAVQAAQQKLALALNPASLVDVTSARLDLAKAQVDLENLLNGSTPPSQLAINAGQLAVDLARQKLAQVSSPIASGVATAHAELSKAQADLAAARQAADPATMSSLGQAVSAAKAKLAAAQHPPATLVRTARSDLQRSVADLSVLRARGGPASSIDLALSSLKVQIAQERVTAANDLAQRLVVRALAPGTVTSVLATPGVTVDAATPIVRAPDLSHLLVTLNLSELDVARASPGNRARVSVDALGGRSVTGIVRSIAPTGIDTNGVVTFPVTVELTRPPARLRPGMSASVKIQVASRPNAVRVPLDAVGDPTGDTKVTVVSGARQIERDVKLGLADAKYVEVRSGLVPGERVLPKQPSADTSQGP